MKAELELKRIILRNDIEQCWEVALLLRPHLNKEKWFTTVVPMMQTEKYRIAGIFDKGNGVAFTGYREMTSQHSGNIIYIDDLCTLESYHSNGLAIRLHDFVNSVAIADNKHAVLIDAGYSNNRA